jgi:hypothetical protein
MILGDQIPSPRTIHTKVTIESLIYIEKVLKKGSQKVGGVRAMNACMVLN